MRRDLRLRAQTLIEALENLGYSRMKYGMDWKHRNFHVTISPHKDKLMFNLHVDTQNEMSSSPYSHHSRQHGKDVTKEYRRIIQEYRRLKFKHSDFQI
jgi:hypothetical protein